MNLFEVQKQFSVYIFYGSANGFVESVVNAFHEKLKKETRTTNVKSDTLNNFFNYNINKGDFVFILISTTGEGEFPENAKNFQKMASKNKAALEDRPINYSLFAFGDSNYKSFCHTGKVIDRLLKSVKATKFMDTEFHDDALIGNESNEKIDIWMKNNVDYIMNYKNDLFHWFTAKMGGS